MNTEFVRRFLRNLLTENDNETYDLLRLGAVAGVGVFLWLALVNADKFDPQTFGIGFGAVMVAASAAFRINESSKTETPK